jgi:cytochrome P450
VTDTYFNIADPSFVIDSEEVLRAREESWYVRTNYGLAVLRYDEVAELLRDRRLKQGSAAWPAHHGVEGPFADWWSKALLNLEGDDHARLRRLLNPVFAPKAISEMAPRFRALGNELVDAFAEEGRCEFMSQFSEPYAARVIAILLGIPESEWRKIAEWGTDLGISLSIAIREELPRIEAALEGLYGFADELIADRREEPKDDFVTRLVQAEQDEDRLSHDELRVSLVLLIFGGMDTTRNQIGLAMQMFLDRPDEWRRLAEEPDLAEAAVEEVMRLSPTTTWVTRQAVENFTFRGLEIEEGTTLHLFSQSAGSDPRVFEDPGFDPEAERPRHFGFGGGRHHCIGHFVARMDMSEALKLLAQRLRDPRVDGEVKSLPRSGNTGPIELPIAFTATPEEDGTT